MDSSNKIFIWCTICTFNIPHIFRVSAHIFLMFAHMFLIREVHTSLRIYIQSEYAHIQLLHSYLLCTYLGVDTCIFGKTHWASYSVQVLNPIYIEFEICIFTEKQSKMKLDYHQFSTRPPRPDSILHTPHQLLVCRPHVLTPPYPGN